MKKNIMIAAASGSIVCLAILAVSDFVKAIKAHMALNSRRKRFESEKCDCRKIYVSDLGDGTIRFSSHHNKKA